MAIISFRGILTLPTDQAVRSSSEIVLMKEGRIVSTGSASHVITKKNIKNVFGIEVEVIMPHYLVVPMSQGLSMVSGVQLGT